MMSNASFWWLRCNIPKHLPYQMVEALKRWWILWSKPRNNITWQISFKYSQKWSLYLLLTDHWFFWESGQILGCNCRIGSLCNKFPSFGRRYFWVCLYMWLCRCTCWHLWMPPVSASPSAFGFWSTCWYLSIPPASPSAFGFWITFPFSNTACCRPCLEQEARARSCIRGCPFSSAHPKNLSKINHILWEKSPTPFYLKGGGLKCFSYLGIIWSFWFFFASKKIPKLVVNGDEFLR